MSKLDIDFSKVAKDIEWVLDEYHIPHKDDVIRDTIVPTWFKRKQPLLKVFADHPDWNNDTVSIMSTVKSERKIDPGITLSAIHTLINYTRHDGIRIPDEAYTVADNSRLTTAKITKENYPHWRELCPPDKEPNRFFPVGLRTSKAYDRLFKYHGFDKGKSYNKYFAVVADSVSPRAVDLNTCISFHPCDYLLMSMGNSWSSCHMINGGGWQGGTWSYMLDMVSSILYTTETDKKADNMWWIPKINRMVTCFQDKEILFSRLYPDSRDADKRAMFRHFVQSVYAQCLDMEDRWRPPMQTTSYKDCDLVRTGTGYMQYRDYDSSDWRGELSVAYDFAPTPMYIGTYGICPICGENYSNPGHMTKAFGVCAHCGKVIYSGNDAYGAEGHLYCNDCFRELFTQCAYCGEYHRTENMHETVHDNFVCGRCAILHYTSCAECGLFVPDYEIVLDAHCNRYCPDCADNLLTTCAECEELFPTAEIAEHNGRFLCEACLNRAIEAEREAEEREVATYA